MQAFAVARELRDVPIANGSRNFLDCQMRRIGKEM